MGVKNVVITLAEKGVYFATHDGKEGKIDAVQDVDVKDTTGAGWVITLFLLAVISFFCHDYLPYRPQYANTHLDASDTFVGMYAVEYLQQKRRGEWDIVKAIKYACKASARTIERLGAQESIPWIDEIDA